MEKTKLEKGITLIALIITIVVLLILAVVTIGAVQESSIIEHAQNAGKTYNQAKDNETTAILGYEQLIEDSINPPEELNFWQEKGLTSENVKFDTLYKGTINLDGSDQVMIFGFYSNGDLCVNFSKVDTNIDIKDEDGNNNIGNNGVNKEEIIGVYEGLFYISSNTITFPVYSEDYNGEHMTIRCTTNNTVEVYYGVSSDFDENGHIPESTTYLKGTLSEQ